MDMWRAGAVLAWVVTCLLVVGSVGLGVALVASGGAIFLGVVLSGITVALGVSVLTGFCGRRLWRQGAR